MFLNSCDSLQGSKQLRFLDSGFSFYIDSEYGAFQARGIWQFKDHTLSTIPHSVVINCNKDLKECTKLVVYLDGFCRICKLS